jgi:hypothetical protein
MGVEMDNEYLFCSTSWQRTFWIIYYSKYKIERNVI